VGLSDWKSAAAGAIPGMQRLGGFRRGKPVQRSNAAQPRSPLDPWLKIEGSRDARVEWQPQTNGYFTAVVGSVTHRGGKDFCYRLSVERAKPDFRAKLEANALSLTRGATNELKLELKRLRGFTNELNFEFRELPKGVTMLTTNLAPKGGTVSIQITAADDAPQFQGPIRLLLVDKITREQRAVPFELTTPGETGFNQLLIETCDQLWLTFGPSLPKHQRMLRRNKILERRLILRV